MIKLRHRMTTIIQCESLLSFSSLKHYEVQREQLQVTSLLTKPQATRSTQVDEQRLS